MEQFIRLSLAVACGSAAGGVARYWSGSALQRLLGATFPWGTFAVNVIGCGLMGFLATWAMERADWSPEMRLLLTTGLLGGFTTFSAFSHETLRLAENGDWPRALANITATLILTLLAVWAGATLARVLR